MKIEKMRWYRILIDGAEHVVRVDDRVMKYCVIDYYDGRLWYTGSCRMCKDYVSKRLTNTYTVKGEYIKNDKHKRIYKAAGHSAEED